MPSMRTEYCRVPLFSGILGGIASTYLKSQKVMKPLTRLGEIDWNSNSHCLISLFWPGAPLAILIYSFSEVLRILSSELKIWSSFSTRSLASLSILWQKDPEWARSLLCSWIRFEMELILNSSLLIVRGVVFKRHSNRKAPLLRGEKSTINSEWLLLVYVFKFSIGNKNRRRIWY